jgi:hypothetical protein
VAAWNGARFHRSPPKLGFGIRGSESVLQFSGSHQFVRDDPVKGDDNHLKRSTGRWALLMPDAPIVELEPGGLFYLAVHDAGTSALPIQTVSGKGKTPEELLCYLKTPQGLVFLPEISTCPGDNPAFLTAAGFAWGSQANFDPLRWPDYPPLGRFFFDAMEKREWDGGMTSSMIGGAVMLGIWDEESEDRHGGDQPLESLRYPNTDLLIFRTGPMIHASDINKPGFVKSVEDMAHLKVNYLIENGGGVYSVFMTEWHRQPHTKNEAAFLEKKKVVLDLLEKHSLKIPAQNETQ